MELEKLVRQVVEEVMGREEKVDRAYPKAYLIGRRPEGDMGYTYVREGEYEAVVIGSLSPWELLQFPDPICTEALVKGKPVLLYARGLEHRKHRDTCNPRLYARLLGAERLLKELGVKCLTEEDHKILTAREVRHRLEKGLPIKGRLTPLARDILEESQHK